MKFTKQLAILWAAAIVPALAVGLVQVQWNADRGRVALGTVESWREPVLWVDARSREAYDAGHWPGAVLLNLDEWDALVPGFLEAWDPDARIVVYCDTGACRTSEEVAGKIRTDFGHERVFSLEGGWDSLKGRAP